MLVSAASQSLRLYRHPEQSETRKVEAISTRFARALRRQTNSLKRSRGARGFVTCNSISAQLYSTVPAGARTCYVRCCRSASSCARAQSGVALLWCAYAKLLGNLRASLQLQTCSSCSPSMLHLPHTSDPAPRPARFPLRKSTELFDNRQGATRPSPLSARGLRLFPAVVAYRLQPLRALFDRHTRSRNQQLPVTAAPQTLASSDEFAHDHPHHPSCVIADGDGDEDDSGLPVALLHPRFRVQLHSHLCLDHRE